jgi:predicted acylesterase/phospholipase RssA
VKLGLFLTPGAARTAYQVGAVQALVEDAGLRFDVIAASSVGALNGAFTATGQVHRLATLWSGWRNRDIFRTDLAALAKGGVFWSPNLMHNHPQRREVIDRYLSEANLTPGVRFRINLANLTTGVDDVFEWPGSAVDLADGVDASVAVPAAIRPHDLEGMQYADGLTVDGFPLERLLLTTGVERAFVVGVAPRSPRPDLPRGPLATLLAAAEWNQHTEVTRGLARSVEINSRAHRWEAARRRALEAVDAATGDPEARSRARGQVEDAFERHRHGRRPPVEIVPILPQSHTKMFFTTYRPERSRLLLAQGRRDALAVLERLR